MCTCVWILWNLSDKTLFACLHACAHPPPCHARQGGAVLSADLEGEYRDSLLALARYSEHQHQLLLDSQASRTHERHLEVLEHTKREIEQQRPQRSGKLRVCQSLSMQENHRTGWRGGGELCFQCVANVCVSACMCLCICVSVCLCVCVCARLCATHTHTHTRTHTHAHTHARTHTHTHTLSLSLSLSLSLCPTGSAIVSVLSALCSGLQVLKAKLQHSNQFARDLRQRGKRSLMLAMLGFLEALRFEKANTHDLVFRLCALWFKNLEDDDVQCLVEAYNAVLPSLVWLPLIYQLAARYVRVCVCVCVCVCVPTALLKRCSAAISPSTLNLLATSSGWMMEQSSTRCSDRSS